MTMIDMSQRFHNRPLMISEEVIENMNLRQMTTIEIEDGRVSAAAMWSSVYAGERKPYTMQDNIAIIPVNGTLYHKVDWAGYSYTGYDWIRNMIEFAKNDQDVDGIVFDFTTGGGEVDGAFETAQIISELGLVKPTLGLANSYAYSAGYLLLAATNKINITATGGVGSIGVVTRHMDVSEAMSDAGYKLTFIYKGKHKVDGNMYEPLPKDVRTRIESRLDVPYNLFVDAVATYRSMDSQSVRDTEAETFDAQEALSLGLVDTVGSSDDAIAAFVAEINGKQWGKLMSTASATTEQTTTNAAATGDDASKVVNENAVNAAREEGMKVGAETERARIMGILKSDDAKGRSNMAIVLCEQGMTTESAKAILAASPAVSETTTAAASTSFAQAMVNTPNPEVANASNGNTAEVPAHMKAINALTAATGEKFKV